MEVHLEQQQEPGLLAMGISKVHCSQTPEIPPSPQQTITTITSLQARHQNLPQTAVSPQNQQFPAPAPQLWAPGPTQELGGEM